jgi:transcriptional activator SPT8
MEDVDEAENENENEGDEEENEEEEEEDGDGDETADISKDAPNRPAGDGNATAQGEAAGASDNAETRKSPTPQKASTPLPTESWRLRVRPEAVRAKLYDIVPTMAAPQSTSINALSVTPDLRYWMTGGSDGYIRKYDGPGTINGKQLLTVAQRHPFVDSVTKAGILMSYWENEEPAPPNSKPTEEHVGSPVYSLAVHSQALWLLSGLESGGINLYSVRHDEGKRITCLQQHTNAVSVLSLAADEKSVLSGSWDKNVFDWDLNTGRVKRTFDGSGGQISAIEQRPAHGAPIPADISEPIKSETFSSNNGKAVANGSFFSGTNGAGQNTSGEAGGAAIEASPAHESLFGGSDAGSLFGDTVGGGFGGDDDEFSQAMEMTLHGDSAQDGGMDHSADMAMTSVDAPGRSAFDPETAPPPAVQPLSSPTLKRVETASASGDADAANGMTATASSNPPTENLPQASPPAVPTEAGSSADAPSQAANDSSTTTQPPLSPSLVFSSQPTQSHLDPTQSSDSTFFSVSFDGTIRIWDRRMPNPAARIGNRPGVPPWCMGACWSPDGNKIYAGRRNGTVEEFNIHHARSSWQPDRILRFPAGSGAVSAVRAMPNGRHLVWYVLLFISLRV